MDERGYTLARYHIRHGQRGEPTPQNLHFEKKNLISTKKAEHQFGSGRQFASTIHTDPQTRILLHLEWFTGKRFRAIGEVRR